jgi:hypothetical protein
VQISYEKWPQDWGVSGAGLLMVTYTIIIFLHSCTHCHVPFFIALFYYCERTVTRYFFIALFFLRESGRTRKGIGSRVSVPGPGSGPRSKGTDPSDPRRIWPQEFSNYQVVSLKKTFKFFAMYILVDASLYIFGSRRIIKKRSTLTPTWDFGDYQVEKKQFF